MSKAKNAVKHKDVALARPLSVKRDSEWFVLVSDKVQDSIWRDVIGPWLFDEAYSSKIASVAKMVSDVSGDLLEGICELDNQSIERDRLDEIGLMVKFVEFLSFTLSDKEMIIVVLEFCVKCVIKNAESAFSLSPGQMALWNSQREDHTSDWLRTVPISGLRQTMNGKTYRCALCYQLGISLFFLSKPCSAFSRVFAGNIYRDHVMRFLALGWHLEGIHVTWAHLEKKRTRLRLYTIYLEELCIQSVETASQVSSDNVRIFMVTATWI
ncbi:hypothetical protein Tco_0481928 [Tanacetum coccineum]